MPHYALGEFRPQFDTTLWVAPNATVIGDVYFEENTSVWWNAVLRADTARISVGANSNIQDNSVLHVDHDTSLTIGKGVTIGHLVMLHGCTVGDNCLIGIGAIILNRSIIGKNTIVGAGSLIPEGKVFPEGVLIMGSPGKVIRDLTQKELDYIQNSASHYVENSRRYRNELDQILTS